MMRIRRYKSLAQSTTEYAVLLAIVAAALVAMQIYMKRGIQGRLRDLANQISPEQYERGSTVSNSTTHQEAYTTQVYGGGTYSPGPAGGSSQVTTTTSNENITRSSSETVVPKIQ